MSTPNFTTQFPSVGSGQMVSSAFEIGRAVQIGLIVPTIDSAQMFLAGGLSLTGPFWRLGNVNSVQVGIPIAAGSASLMLGTALLASKYGRIEFSVSQSAVRSLTVLTRVG